MENFELIVMLKVPDTVALTAEDTLQRKMGYGERLKHLHRGDYWKIGIDGENQDNAEKILQSIIEKTTIFVNPNKHFYSINRKPLAKCMGCFSVDVLVTEADDDESDIVTRLHRQGFDKVISVEKGILWHFELQTNSQEEAESLAREMTISKSRKEGLLANPHYQKIEII